MPRFVLLVHDHPELHWDLMLECGEVLRTWRLAAPPLPGQTIPAAKLLDHRRFYLDYEGPVSGDRGRVTRWDSGSYRWAGLEPAEEGETAELVFEGERLRGHAHLAKETSGGWSFTALGST